MESNGSMNIKVWLERLRERRPDLVDSGFFNNNDPDEVAANVYKSAAGLSPIYTKSYPTGDNFNESDHPRDEDGKFGSGGGSSKTHTEVLHKYGFTGGAKLASTEAPNPKFKNARFSSGTRPPKLRTHHSSESFPNHSIVVYPNGSWEHKKSDSETETSERLGIGSNYQELNEHLKNHGIVKDFSVNDADEVVKAFMNDGPFQKLENKLAHKKGVTDPAALAAKIGREELGEKEMERRSLAGKGEDAVVKDFLSKYA
jgi:hypothetical protein